MVTSLHQEKCLIARGVLNTYTLPSSGKFPQVVVGDAKQTFSFPAVVTATDWFS